MRGEWIEIEIQYQPDGREQSPLMRGEWIEMSYTQKKGLQESSPLMRGEWIEIQAVLSSAVLPLRLPS